MNEFDPTMEERIERAISCITEIHGEGMNRWTFSPCVAETSQMEARSNAVGWIMLRYTGPMEFYAEARRKLLEVIPLDTDWTFSDRGKGACYEVVRHLCHAFDQGVIGGSISTEHWFAKKCYVFSFCGAIVVHDPSEGPEWKCIETYIHLNDS